MERIFKSPKISNEDIAKELSMERKFEIPKMSNEEIAKRYATIKPIVKKEGTPTYLRELENYELTKKAFNWLTESTDYGEVVDYTKLSILTDVKMLHGYGYYGFFKPSVGEVIRQIPKEYLHKVVAFEIIRGGIGMDSIYKAELDEGFHVSIVRLYQVKDSTNCEAYQMENYPTKDSEIPMGMTLEEFNDFKALFGAYLE